MRRPAPLRPDRLRRLERPFSWIPFRILTSGLLAQLSGPAKLLYFFLCLVADHNGVSFYGEQRLEDVLGLSGGELEGARQELCERDLLAFDGRVYQLLSWPQQPSPPPLRRGRRRGAAGHPQPIGKILQQLWES